MLSNGGGGYQVCVRVLLIVFLFSYSVLSLLVYIFFSSGNSYSIKNLRKDNAKLSYVLMKYDDQSDTESEDED